MLGKAHIVLKFSRVQLASFSAQCNLAFVWCIMFLKIWKRAIVSFVNPVTRRGMIETGSIDSLMTCHNINALALCMTAHVFVDF